MSLILLAAGAFIHACTPDKEIDTIAPRDLAKNSVSVCETCDYQYLYKTVGNDIEVVGSVAICQDAENITLTYTVSADREEAWFQQSGYGVFLSQPTKLNPSPGYLIEKESHHGDQIRSVTYTIPLADLGEFGDPGDVIYLASYAVVPGPDGTGGMVWAGDLLASKGNPNSRYYAYTIKDCETPEPPTENCTFTQGYWFAKPNGSQWPGNTNITGITFGGEKYTYSDARAIFFGSNSKTGKTIAKQAFLQGLALKLSIAGGADLSNGTGACYGILAELAKIEAYFDAINIKATPNNINTSTFNKASCGGVTIQELNTAATRISDCLNQNHCDNTPC